MKRNVKTLVASALFAVVLLSTACEKLIEIDPPLNETSTALAFGSDKLAKSTLSGMYSTLASSATQASNLSVYRALQADELMYLATNSGLVELMNNTYIPSSSPVSDPWSAWYNIIYQANSIIEGLQAIQGTTAPIKKQLTAEAMLMRAYCYIQLVNTYGDVPLIVQTDVNITAFQPRETADKVYTQIITDLNKAKADLLPDYSFSAGARVGVNKFTAAALLARAYMFTGNYVEAEQNSTEVISSSLYSLIPGAKIGTDVFLRDNVESIWQLSAPLLSTNQYTSEGSTLIPQAYTATYVTYRLNPNLVALFESADLRRTQWMVDATIAGQPYSFPFKYKNRTQALAVTNGTSENQVIMRLAEQYLIRAEARARIGTNLSGALSDLNVIRQRANATLSVASSKDPLLADIEVEYRREFFCEQGLRWAYLKRTGTVDAVIGALKSTYTSRAKVFPIPQTAMDANPNLIQNKDY